MSKKATGREIFILRVLPKNSGYNGYDAYNDLLVGIFNITGILRSSLEFPGVPRSSPEFPGVPWSSPEFPGVPWSSSEFPGVPRSSSAGTCDCTTESQRLFVGDSRVSFCGLAPKLIWASIRLSRSLTCSKGCRLVRQQGPHISKPANVEMLDEDTILLTARQGNGTC